MHRPEPLDRESRSRSAGWDQATRAIRPEESVRVALQSRERSLARGPGPAAEALVQRAQTTPGQPLPAALQPRFEASLGKDLSAVRVHLSRDSAAASGALGARAYALGQDVHFAAGEYNPQSLAGQRLLAHEVAHTVQHSGGVGGGPSCKLEVSQPYDPEEIAADRAAEAMVAGRAASAGRFDRAPSLQRDCGPTNAEVYQPCSAGPVPTDAELTAEMMKITQGFQGILEKQGLGLDRLKDEYGTKDQPSLGETVLMFAVETALGAAAGKIGSAVGTLAGSIAQKGVGAALSAGATKVTAGEQHWIDAGMMEGPTKPSIPQIAASVASFVGDKVKGKVTEAGKARLSGAASAGAFNQFISAQKEALIDGKVAAQNAVLESQAQFKVEDGLKAAQAVSEAVYQQYESAITTQYIESLKEWWNIAGTGSILDREVALRITIDLATPSGALQVVGAAAPGLNDAMRKTLREDSRVGQLTLEKAGMKVILIVRGKAYGDWLSNHEMTIKGRAGGRVTDWPQSGDGMWWLFHRQEGRIPNRQDGADDQTMIAQIQAQLILNQIGSKALKDLPELDD